MINNSLKKTKHEIKPQDVEEFAAKMDHYSGSDISIVVKDAVMQPVRLLQNTNKFKLINDNGKAKFMPMHPNATGPDI